MAFDASPGGDPRGPWCRGCQQPIELGQSVLWIEFTANAPDKLKHFNGPFHSDCARPILSCAHVLHALNRWVGQGGALG